MPSDLKVVSAVPDKPAKKVCGTVLDGIGQKFLDRQGRAGINMDGLGKVVNDRLVAQYRPTDPPI